MTPKITALVRLVFVAALALAALLRPAHAGPNDGLPRPNADLSRATPKQTWDGFLAATRQSDWPRAAHFLDLRSVPKIRQANEGPELARKLAYVLERKLATTAADLPDVPEPPAPQHDLIVAHTLFMGDEPVPVALARVRFDDGVYRWLIARTTVQTIPELYLEHGARGWEERLPPVLVRTRIFGVEAWQWLALLAAAVLSWIGGYVGGSIVAGIARRIASRTRTPWDDELVVAARGPVRLGLGVGTLQIVEGPMRFTPGVQTVVDRIAFPILVVAIVWLVMASLGVGTKWILSRLPSDPEAELRSRGLKTQLALMRRVTSVILVVVAGAVILMQFDFVRSVGLSILASAGLLGVVLGLAAQKSLAGVIAGVQLSITQPIRIGDSVVVEGEFGTIEEINLTYVVVKVWDERRLMVPIGRFLDSPFQNWTKTGSELIGVVLLPVDYATPVELLRAEVERLAKADPRWDGRVCRLHVVDVTEKCLVARILVSARNGGDAWELRCMMREKVLQWLSAFEGGRYLSQMRTKPVDPLTSPPVVGAPVGATTAPR